jgi:NIMA (never in mitosis gene a)-related kinase
MEFADDGDMSEKIGRRRVTNSLLDEEFILRNLVQVAQALFYLHSRGILHRDIKTANLFLNKSGVLKLGDFGIARILEDNADRVSARTCRTPVGTPLYMSPELCTGASYGQKADMWALGCVLYEVRSSPTTVVDEGRYFQTCHHCHFVIPPRCIYGVS